MSDLVRKQIYIHRRQEILLKRLAKEQSQSEAEIIRQAIDLETARLQITPAQFSHAAWEVIEQLIAERRLLGRTGEPYRWNREEIYTPRPGRWMREKLDGEG